MPYHLHTVSNRLLPYKKVNVRILLAYILVLPVSFLGARLGAIVVGGSIAFALIWSSVWFRSTIAGFVGCLAGVLSAVAVGWYIFNWVVGPGSFTFVPFMASVFLFTISIPKDIRHARQLARTRGELQASGYQFSVANIGNPWSMAIGDIVGLVIALAWFLLK